MARKCKCWITKEEGTTDTFIKIGSHYYKSQEVYDNAEKNKKIRQEVIDLLANYMGYQAGQVFPTIMLRRLKELEFYGYECILETIKQQDRQINWALQNKDFNNDSQCISYIMAIIKNHINDVYKELKELSKAKKKIENNILDVEVTNETELISIGTKKSGRDISSFLED